MLSSARDTLHPPSCTKHTHKRPFLLLQFHDLTRIHLAFASDLRCLGRCELNVTSSSCREHLYLIETGADKGQEGASKKRSPLFSRRRFHPSKSSASLQFELY